MLCDVTTEISTPDTLAAPLLPHLQMLDADVPLDAVALVFAGQVSTAAWDLCNGEGRVGRKVRGRSVAEGGPCGGVGVLIACLKSSIHSHIPGMKPWQSHSGWASGLWPCGLCLPWKLQRRAQVTRLWGGKDHI